MDMKQFVDRYANLDDMAAWAEDLMASREPDTVIGGNYMERWYVLPRSEYHNVYLHRILRSDDDRAMHDHPWPSTSLLLSGGYIEHTPDGVFPRKAGDMTTRAATDIHRLEVYPDQPPCVSLFLTGPIENAWGFHPLQPDGTRTFVPWREWV